MVGMNGKQLSVDTLQCHCKTFRVACGACFCIGRIMNLVMIKVLFWRPWRRAETVKFVSLCIRDQR